METTNLKLLCDEGPSKGKCLECLPKSITRIGRAERFNNFSICDPGISRTHLEIERDGENWMIVDSNSSNGTQVNGKKIPKCQNFSINDGDAIKVGVETILVAKIEKKIENSESAADKQQSGGLWTGKNLAKNMSPVIDVSKIFIELTNPVVHGINVEGNQKNADSSLVNPESYDAPKSLIDQDVETNDEKKLEDSDHSGCQLKTDLPSIPEANRPSQKRKSKVDFSVNQPKRQTPRRAATKKYATKKPDLILGVLGGAKILTDESLKRDVRISNCKEDVNSLRPCLPRGAAKKSFVKEQLPKTSEKIGLENNILGHQEIESKHKLKEKTATKRCSETKTYVHLQDVEDPNNQNVSRQPTKTRKGSKDCTNMQSDEALVSNDSRACQLQHEKFSDTSNVEVKKNPPKEVLELKDLEGITLGEWFDRMEKHISNKIDAIADEIIAQLKQEHCV